MSMTWTNIHPNLNKYHGCHTPEAVADFIFAKNTPWEKFCNIDYVISMPDREDDPCNKPIDNKEWMKFWKPVYDLRDKPRDEWTDKEALSYFSMDLLIHWV